MESIFSVSLRGLLNGFSRASDNAEKISKAFRPESPEDPVKPLTDLRLNEFQVKASAKVIKTGDEMLGTVVDLLA